MIYRQVGALGSGMVIFIMQSPNGLGRHRQTTSDEDFLKFRRYGWVYSVVCAVFSFSMLKISIALSLLRLSKARWFTWSLYGLLGEQQLPTSTEYSSGTDNDVSVHHFIHDRCFVFISIPLSPDRGKLQRCYRI